MKEATGVLGEGERGGIGDAPKPTRRASNIPIFLTLSIPKHSLQFQVERVEKQPLSHSSLYRGLLESSDKLFFSLLHRKKTRLPTADHFSSVMCMCDLDKGGGVGAGFCC